MIPLPYKIIAALVAFIAIAGAFLGYGHYQFTKGGDIATKAANAKINRLKLDAAAVLATETARATAAEQALQAFTNNQEIKDADNQKTISGLADQLRRAAGISYRLRDPNAAPGCRLGGGSAPGQSATTPSAGADNGAEAGGLFSAGATELFQRLTSEADEINAAYASCRPYALEVSKPPPD